MQICSENSSLTKLPCPMRAKIKDYGEGQVLLRPENIIVSKNRENSGL